jgi:diaminohydroxyphosphoribosylaminopyrimidine deaminase/5-amino-6-(5-phosphoribosylamino)uracil reductase
MQRALELARKAEGRTSPNPMVGAVLVAGGEVVGEGFHAAAGRPHAEVEALRGFSRQGSDCTLYVNLEPCCHHGRTPPCTQAILAAGIRRVVVGMVDPDPRVQGKGIEELRAAGVEVQVGVLEAEARHLNRGFVSAKSRKRPWVALKAALTLDGRIASDSGDSRWITGEPARLHGHGLRNVCDAILVGRGTLIADDPALSCRVEGGRDPVPVVLDGRLRSPATARLWSGSREAIVFCSSDADVRIIPNTKIIPIGTDQRGLDLGLVLQALLADGHQRVLVEGGAKVQNSFLHAGLVDELHLYLNPRVLGAGPVWGEGAGFTLGAAPRFQLRECLTLGGDLYLGLDAERDSSG